METILADRFEPELPVAMTLHSDIEHLIVLCPFCRNTHKHETITKPQQETVAVCKKGHYMLKKDAIEGKSIDFALRRREQTNEYKRKIRSDAKNAKNAKHVTFSEDENSS